VECIAPINHYGNTEKEKEKEKRKKKKAKHGLLNLTGESALASNT